MISLYKIATVLIAINPLGGNLSSQNFDQEPIAAKIAIAGYCQRDDSSLVDMRDLWILENDAVYDVGSTESVTISGESVVIRQNGNDRSHRIDRMFAGDSSVDVVLRFAIIDNEPVLFWRESYLHRVFQQGLVRFSNGTVSSMCLGAGGIEVVD